MTTHELFIVNYAGQKRESVIQLLQFISSIKKVLDRMEIKIDITTIEESMMQNPKLVAALQSRGITALPALCTARNKYFGRTEITRVYSENVTEFLKSARQSGAQHDDNPQDSILDDYYANAIKQPEIGDDDQAGEQPLKNIEAKMAEHLNIRKKAGRPIDTPSSSPGPSQHVAQPVRQQFTSLLPGSAMTVTPDQHPSASNVLASVEASIKNSTELSDIIKKISASPDTEQSSASDDLLMKTFYMDVLDTAS